MSNMKNDPSALYDADFKKKREQLLEDGELSDEDGEGFLIDDDEDDVFEERRSLFSRFKRKSKRSRKTEDEDEENDGYDIFDLERLTDGKEENGEKPKKPKKEKADKTQNPKTEEKAEKAEKNEKNENRKNRKKESDKAEEKAEEPPKPEPEKILQEQGGQAQPLEKIDDINALLQSVGIAPLGDEPGEQSKKEETAEKENDGGEADEKTKHFSLPGFGKKADRDEKIRENLMDNFRVLAKEAEDKPILERREGKNPAESLPDTLETANGENIFDAVDRAGSKKKSSLKKLRENAEAAQRKKRREEEALSVSALSQKIGLLTKKTLLGAKIVLALGAVSLILSFLPPAYKPDGALEFLFGSGARVYTAVQLLLFAGSAAFSLDLIKDAVGKVKLFRTDSAACLLLMSAFAAIHSIMALITGMNEQTGFNLYIPCVIFAFFALLCGSYKRFETMSKSLNMMVKAEKLSGLSKVENSADASALAHGISDSGEPLIYFSGKAKRPRNFSALFESSQNGVKLIGVISLAVLLLSFIFSAVWSVASKNPNYFATGLVSFICFCLPVLRDTVLEFIRSGINAESIKKDSAAALSFDSCGQIGRANAVVLDAGDIFEGKISKFRLVPGAGMTLTDAVVFAACTLKGTGSLISGAFDEFLAEAKIKLPEAEDKLYEERLGYSAWIAGRSVLVGNRKMLIQHSIAAPSKEEERQYSKNKSVMYVAVEGKIAATFIVSYPVRPAAKENVGCFAKNGLVLMLNCADSCLTESYVAKRLGTEEASIKFAGTKGSKILAECRKNASSSGGGLVCGRKQKGLLSIVNAAHQMYSAERTVNLLSIAAAVFSIVLLVLCTALNITAFVSALSVIVMQTLWGAAEYLIGSRAMK